MTALATPFAKDWIDERAFAHHAAWQVEQGSSALVTGTVTGEAPTLSEREHERLISIAVEAAHQRIPVIAGLVTNCTDRAVEQARMVRRVGAQALLVTIPPYNKPTQDGLFRHVEAISRAVDLPLIVQNDVAHTGLALKPETLDRLLTLPSMVGFIDTRNILHSASDLRQSNDLVIAVPTPGWSVPSESGTLSIAANVAPRLCASLHETCRSRDCERAGHLQRRLHPLQRALDLEPDPAPVKYALFLVRHHFSPSLRLPLVEVSPRTACVIAAALAALRDDAEFET